VREAIAAGRLRGDEVLPARATVAVEGLGQVEVTGEIALS
jgi:hypothetical protein